MELSDEQVNVNLSRPDLETAGSSRASTRGSLRFGTLSHHSFFSRHNPHPHRVRHMQGLNGKPVCTVNDDWFGFTPLCPHPLIKSQVSVSGSRSSAFLTPEISSDRSGPRAALLSESWREELKDLATKVSVSAAAETQQHKREKLVDEEVPRRKTQYSSQSGRIIPSSSWGGKKRSSRTSHKRTAAQPRHMQTLEGLELKVLELLCQILQTDSLSMVQQWLLLASDREKELVQGLLQQAMSDCASLTSNTAADPLLPVTSEHLPHHKLLDAADKRKRSSLHRSENVQDEPERIGEAEVLTLYPEHTGSIKPSLALLLSAIILILFTMLPAVLKLCCGISYPHVRSMAGLQRAALAAFGQEIRRLQNSGRFSLSARSSFRRTDQPEAAEQRTAALADEDVFYQRQGEAALSEALQIVESRDGWKLEMVENNGDVIYSKVLKGNRKVFRLEAELDATADELHDILFFRVEEMHEWNPSIRRITVLKHSGENTMVTHEVSAETAGNLIGHRDFLSVRHSSKSQSTVYLGGAATRFESLPPQPGFVRAEDGPTCIILQPLQDQPDRSRFIWLLNMDIKGWLPQSLVNKALPRAQVDFTRHLRRRLDKHHSR